VLIRQFAADVSVVRAALGGITAGAVLGCLTVWLNWNEHVPIFAFPLYGHGRVFGLHMMIGTMTGLALLIEHRGKKMERLVIGLGASIACGGLLWAGGRSGLLGVGVGLVTWLLRIKPRDRLRLLAISLIVILGGLTLSFINWAPQSYLGWWTAAERSAAATSIDEFTSTRSSFWRVTWQYFTRNPWFGRGADAYRYLTPKLDGDQPHNWILQFLLDFGICGGGALTLLLARQALRNYFSPAVTGDLLRRGVGAGVVACLITGLFDGVFYHGVALVPAALLLGMSNTPNSRRENVASSPFLIRILKAGRCTAAVASLIILAIHSYLVFHLRYQDPPSSPESLPARVLRVFPSSIHGIDRWIVQWRTRDETAALEWTLWAQRYMPGPAPLHLYAAVIYADRDEFAAADREMERALQTAHWSSRANLEHMRMSIRAAAGTSASLAK
jgi:hypothetical protein